MHGHPSKHGLIRLIRRDGAKAVYGEDWPLSDGETLAEILAGPPPDKIGACDHVDPVTWQCLGHEDRP